MFHIILHLNKYLLDCMRVGKTLKLMPSNCFLLSVENKVRHKPSINLSLLNSDFVKRCLKMPKLKTDIQCQRNFEIPENTKLYLN